MKRLTPVSKIILFLTSYIPLGIILLIIDFDKFTYPFFQNEIYAFVIIILIILLPILLFFFLNHFKHRTSGWEKVKVKSVENMDSAILSYIFTYILPFLSFPEERRIVVIVFMLIIIGILYTRSDMLGINPLLAVWGYHIVKIVWKKDDWPQSKEAILISKHDYYYIKQVKQSEIINVFQLQNELYLLKEENND